MSLWEYKIITSGRGGFASPALLEKFLNDLGREEWEIVQFHAQPDNFLVFTGLARRPTQRDWTLEDAAAAAAKAEADKLRAEFEAKFKAVTSGAPAAEESPASFLEEKVAPDDGFRKPVDTSHDADADEDETKEEDDWDKLTAAEEDELPTFFDAIKPHMRRNQRGPGMSVGVDYLAKKWDQSEDDLKGALQECGFTIPADEDAKAEYLEFEGDLYWININRRGELWINTKEKPRPVFRSVKAQKVAVEEEPKAEAHKPEGRKGEERSRKSEGRSHPGAAAGPAEGEKSPSPPAPEAAPAEPAAPAALPAGPELLQKIRPMMRRNRRGPGGSGSTSFLSRALKCREADLVDAFKALGLVVPSSANEKPVYVEIGDGVWWTNIDSRGNVWINGRDKKPGETIEAPTASAETPAAEPESGAPASAVPSGDDANESSVAPEVPLQSAPEAAVADAVPAPEVAPAASVESQAPAAMGAAVPANSAEPPAPGAPTDRDATLQSVRPRLKETRTGAFAARLDRLADEAGHSADDLVAQLVAAGLVVPEKAREKPVFVESAGEIFWLNRNAKGELWLNAKASRFAEAKSDEEPGAETEATAEGEAGADGGEKRTRRPRSRKKPE